MAKKSVPDGQSDPQTRVDWGIPELTGDGDRDRDGESPNYETGDWAGMWIA